MVGFTYNFIDNVSYGAHDINDIRADIATKGVVPEYDSSLEVIKSGNRYAVMMGVALFDDGSKLEVDVDGVDIAPQTGVKNYVWLERRDALNDAIVKCTTTEPAGMFVKLAEINIDGSVVDKREYGRMRVPAYGSNISSNIFKRYDKGKDLSTGSSWVLFDTINFFADFKSAILFYYKGITMPISFEEPLDANGYHLSWTESVNAPYHSIGLKKVGTKLEIYVKLLNKTYYNVSFYGVFMI